MAGRIPVGRDGKVQFRDLVRRYHEAGSRRDAGGTHSRVVPRDPTPEQIADWWTDPSVCDVEGVDTGSPEIYSVPASIRGRKRRALSKIAVVADKGEADRIRRVLASSFTADELERMAAGVPLMVSVVPSLSGCTGYYVRMQDGYPVPEIVLEEGTTPDGIVHEAVHHLRARDGRAAFPTSGGVLDPRYRGMPRADRDAIVEREERETVAETVARTVPDPVESGYYWNVPGQTSRYAYLRDQEILSRNRALKGSAAIRAVEENYDRTSISRAIIAGRRRKRCRS